MATIQQFDRLTCELADAFERLYPDFSVDVEVVPQAQIGKEYRNFALTVDRTPKKPPLVQISDRIWTEPRHRVEALLAHEYAHAALMLQKQKHTERDADALAERALGKPIYYDGDDVQSTRGGTRPRPAHLG